MTRIVNSGHPESGKHGVRPSENDDAGESAIVPDAIEDSPESCGPVRTSPPNAASEPGLEYEDGDMFLASEDDTDY